MPDINPTIAITQGSQAYGKKTVFSGFSCCFYPGVTVILGPNGAGKTTLLRTLATDLPLKIGDLSILGRKISTWGDTKQARTNLGYLSQDFSADSAFTVHDLLLYALWLKRLPEDQLKITKTLDFVGLSGDAQTKIGKLSGGMRQRAIIASVLVTDPEILLLDEPTVGLDPAQRRNLRELIRSLADRTVIVSTHLVDDVPAIADRVVVMKKGGVKFDGTVSELVGEENEPSAENVESAYLELVDAQ